MSLHIYAPKNLQSFMEILAVLHIKISKARCSHTVHATVPTAMIEDLRENAEALKLTFDTGRFYHRGGGNKCQIVVKAA
mgnify:CR=1 FL=1